MASVIFCAAPMGMFGTFGCDRADLPSEVTESEQKSGLPRQGFACPAGRAKFAQLRKPVMLLVPHLENLD